MNTAGLQDRAYGITCEVVGLHRKKYSSKNCQMSALLKIDVFGLSGLQMEHLINFILFWE